MADPKKGRRHVSGDVLAYIQEREAADPSFAEKLQEEFDRLQLARRIKAVREAMKLSQSELADKVGTKQPALARLESGRVVPRLDLLHRIAAAMGMKLDIRFVPAEKSARKKRASPRG